MANAKIIEMKAAKVAEVVEKINKAKSVVIIDYRGLTVAEVTDLRNLMRKEGIEYVVLKNHTVYRACIEAKIDDSIHEMLHGTSAFAFCNSDPVTAARVLKAFIKGVKKCEIKGGIVEGNVMNAKEMDAIAELPSREVLIAKMLGSMMSPISGLAIAIDQIAKAKAEQNA